MLARSAQPFDSEQYLFEVKWDGIRALAFVDQTGYRLVSRHGQELTPAFPELNFLANLPPGTVLDGELVVFQQGHPQLSLVQGRQALRSEHKIRVRSVTTPATYIVFDQLQDQYRSLLNHSLASRRQILEEMVTRRADAKLVFSGGVIGTGRQLYRQVISRQLEGVMAKRLDSLYQPGKRSGAWLKIKPGALKEESLKVYVPLSHVPLQGKEPA